MYYEKTSTLPEKGSKASSFNMVSSQSSLSENLTVGNYSLNELMRSRPNYFGFGLYSKPSYPDGIFKRAVYHVNSSFSGYVFLANAKKNDYLVFVLLDYKEIPFYLDGKLNLTHYVTLGNMEYRFFRFKIPNVSDGWHDVFVGVFPSPYSTEEQDSHILYGFRLQLIAGEPILRLPFFERPLLCTKNNTELDAYLLLTKKACGNTIWYKVSVNQSSTLKYFAVIGNTEDNLQTFALVQFLDYKQIPIGNRTVYFGYLHKNEIVSVPITLRLPADSTHRLVLLYFAYPYEPLDYPPDIENVNLRFINEQSNVLVLSVNTR
ncbi:hypothetical protein [Thermococcus sp.]|uniref:hypothetical protein n=1 Tax=Thermococcus sp. TaxID=35749 RepID=UPI00262353E2|nr:hypothetical protein [Thermococcus sp.]